MYHTVLHCLGEYCDGGQKHMYGLYFIKNKIKFMMHWNVRSAFSVQMEYHGSDMNRGDF